MARRKRLRVLVGVLAMGGWLASTTSGLGQDDWFDRLAVPLVQESDFASMRDASLRAVGLYPTTDLMLGPWYAIGTFARDGSSSVPLRNIDITAPIRAGKRRLEWKAVEGWDRPDEPLDLAALFPSTKNASAYLYRTIQSPGRASIELRVSADDDFTVWLNGKEVIGRTEDGEAAAYGKHRKRVWLQPGENELLVRAGQADGPWLVFFDFEPQIDPRVLAKTLSEVLKVYPREPESFASRMELARLLLDLGLRERALEQIYFVLSEPNAPAAPRAEAQRMTLSLATRQKWNLFAPDDLTSNLLPIDIKLTNPCPTTVTGQLAFVVKDVWGKPAAEIPAVQYKLGPYATLSRTVGFKVPGWGAYQVAAQARLGKAAVNGLTIVCFVPPRRKGPRPESFFAATVEDGFDAAVCAKIGIKVVRGFFCNPALVLKSFPARAGDPFELDFSRLDRIVADSKRNDLSLLPIVGYARPLESPLAKRLKAAGPPRDRKEFVAITMEIVRRLGDVKYWDFWADPIIYGPTWAGAAANFRYFLKMWARAAKKTRPDIKVLAGGRPSFFADIIMPDPNVVKLLDGLTNCINYDATAPDWRSGAVLRCMDFAVQLARSQRIGLAFVTDGATECSKGRAELGEAQRLDAAKLVKFYVMAALSGNFQASVRQNRGWGENFPAGNVAYAVMAHLLEDRPVVAEIWPRNPLLWGAVFANPRWVTDEVKSLPRADELAARWKVAVPKERGNDPTKVAVIWSQTGLESGKLDRSATLTIKPAGDLRALDMMGRPVGRKAGDALTVPFGQYPVYLLSDKLSVVEMRNRIAKGGIDKATPVNCHVLSLLWPPADGPTTLTVRIQNQLNRPLKGTISLSGPKDWKIEPPRKPFRLEAAELGEVDFRVAATTTSSLNHYLVRLSVESDGGKYERRQVVSAACIQPIKPKIDGKLDEWTTATFARMDSDQLARAEAYMKWLADPSKERQLAKDRAFVGVKVAAGYDEKNFYIAAVVREPGLGNATNGNPRSHGENPLTNGDCLQFAWGFEERAPDGGRQPGDPWYWKGMFRDVDYVVIQFRQRADQPILQSLFVPGLTWRTDYQTEAVNTWRIAGAQTRFIRDEPRKITSYEIAIPRKYLTRFDPSKAWVRFGVVYLNDEKLPALEWSRAAGTFDYWTNFGSFLPAWQPFAPCQTRWGLRR